jgi:hypothetical protein
LGATLLNNLKYLYNSQHVLNVLDSTTESLGVTAVQRNMNETSGFPYDVVEASAHLGYYAAYTGSHLPTF